MATAPRFEKVATMVEVSTTTSRSAVSPTSGIVSGVNGGAPAGPPVAGAGVGLVVDAAAWALVPAAPPGPGSG